MNGPFAKHATMMLDMGYSPIPLKTDRNPLLKGWQNLRNVPLSRGSVLELSGKYPFLGLGVVGGFNGLVIIDFDTDDTAIMAAVASVLPRPNVAKKGSKGFTAFYRSADAIKGCKFLPPPPDPRPLVEVLTTGNSAIPPTRHPKINKEYRWLTPKTLFNTPILDLVTITPAHIDRMREALEPWCPKKEYTVAPTMARELVDDKRMASFARARLRNVAGSLGRLNSGRNWALYQAACSLGKFGHNNIIQEAEIVETLMAACRLNAYAAKDGEEQCRRSIASGLQDSANDALPDLDSLAERSHRPQYRTAR